MYKVVFALVLTAATVKAQPPANDDCSGAIAVSLTPFGPTCSSAIHASTAGATRSTPNPNCTSVENNDDIWYQFTATTQAVLLRFSNVVNDGTGGGATVGFALYAGCPTTTATLICNNIVSAGSSFLVMNRLTPGTVYYLRFWSTLTGVNSASFDFCVQELAQPVNDECSNATLIPTDPVGSTCNGAHHASTVGAQPSTPVPDCSNGFNDDDIWYRFVANTSAVRLNFSNAKTATTVTGNANVGYALYDVNCPGTPVTYSCDENIGSNNGSVLIGGLVPGHQYYLQLYSYATNTFMTLDFCLVDVDLPLNDECINATPLSTSSGFPNFMTTGDLSQATTSAGFGPPVCVPGSSSQDVWFKVMIPASGNLTVQTFAITPDVDDLVMEAYAGTCGSLAFITCDNDGNPDPDPSAGHSSIYFSGRTPGETLYLRVLGYHTINDGPFGICAWDSTQKLPVLPGGDCIPAKTVTINSASNNRFRWVPLYDQAGNIMAEVYANGSQLNEVNASLYVNSSGSIRQHYLDRNLAITANGPGGAKLRLYFTATELAALQQAHPSTTLASMKTSRTNTACEPAIGAVANILAADTVEHYGNDYFIEFGTPSFGSFYVDGINAALPLRFVSFTGQRKQEGVVLQWMVLKDDDIKNFEVQKMNAAGDYETIAKKDAGSSLQYSFTDAALSGTSALYRIKMNTYSGTVLYSLTVTVPVTPLAQLKVVPNPVHDYLTIQSTSAIKGVILLSTTGQVIKSYNNGATVINMQQQQPGLYILQIHCNNSIQQVKVMKY